MDVATVDGEKRTARNTTLFEFAELIRMLAEKFPKETTVSEIWDKFIDDLEKSGELDRVFN